MSGSTEPNSPPKSQQDMKTVALQRGAGHES